METSEALKRLNDLPTADAIADELVSMGVQGRRSSPTSCAIAVYLRMSTGEELRVGLDLGNSTQTVTTRLDRDFYPEPHTAPQVAEFIMAFDAGKYPKLDG